MIIIAFRHIHSSTGQTYTTFFLIYALGSEMCKTIIPKYGCGHVGHPYDVCEDTEIFHGTCEGRWRNATILKHKHCCSEACCETAVARRRSIARQVEQDTQAMIKEDSSQFLLPAKDALDEERKFHENICASKSREGEQRFDAWAVRRESEKVVHKMWNRRWWWE